ncbi:MAG: pyrroline-5-carboxylate reductase [Acidimicrobiales bacterium]
MTTLQVIGGGKMGQALVGGLLAAERYRPDQVIVVELAEAQRRRLTGDLPGVTVTDTPRAGVDSLVAVKPHHVVAVCEGLDHPARLVSVAAGITLAAIEAVLPADTPVIRAMPNTPALVGAGAAAVAGGRAAGPDDVAWARDLLAAVGTAVVVDETQIDAVTGLSGSGPAYVFLIVEALTDAGVSAGLPLDVATVLARQTVYGAGRMLTGAPEVSPAAQRAAVTTPAGTTAAGLRALEQHGVRAALIDAVHAATDRSRQLGAR